MDVSLSSIIVASISAIGIVTVAYIANVVGKKNDAKLVQLVERETHHEETKQALLNALGSLKELQDELHKERESRMLAEDSYKSLERKFTTVKIAFRIILIQYNKYFHDRPEDADLLEEYNKILEH
jgi:ABC-type protease/lipase transport system fused ATPase/permease subunit